MGHAEDAAWAAYLAGFHDSEDAKPEPWVTKLAEIIQDAIDRTIEDMER